MRCFVLNDTATTECDTYCHSLSLHDFRPICTGQALWIAEAEDQCGRAGPRLALQLQPLGDKQQRRLRPLRGGAVQMQAFGQLDHETDADRKSTRLNSSH